MVATAGHTMAVQASRAIAPAALAVIMAALLIQAALAVVASMAAALPVITAKKSQRAGETRWL